MILRKEITTVVWLQRENLRYIINFDDKSIISLFYKK